MAPNNYPHKKLMRKKLIALIVLILGFTSVLIAQSTTIITTKFLAEAGLHYGGEEIAIIEFEDGDEQEMLAGQGLTIALGGEFSLPSFRYALLRTTIGFKYSTTAADNANIMFLRYPLNVMVYAAPNTDIRIGIGTTKHLNATLKGDDFFPDVDFESSLGTRLEIGYKWAALVFNSLTFTDDFGFEYDGGSIGITFSGKF